MVAFSNRQNTIAPVTVGGARGGSYGKFDDDDEDHDDKDHDDEDHDVEDANACVTADVPPLPVRNYRKIRDEYFL